MWLLTGRPGVGKTTCLRSVLEQSAVPAGGFFTEEIRQGGRREGFALVTLSGKRVTLAHVRGSGSPRVGRYTVDIAALDRVGVPAIQEAVRRRCLLVVDEIGKMEMASADFRRAVEAALSAGLPFLGTILKAAHPWADAIKQRVEVQVIEVSPANRDVLPGRLAALVTGALARP